ncbi:MAG: YitT family protein, partial [Bacteroidota bacterium]
MPRKIRRTLRDIAWILAGVVSGAIGLKGFLMPSHFFDGGATGIALMVSAASEAGIGYMVLLVNLPFILLGYFQMSRPFLFRTVISVTTLSMVVTFVEVPTVTTDPVLAAIFGGFFLGAGIGLSIRGGGVI